MSEKEIGKVTHYYSHLNVGIIKLSDTVKMGDEIRIKGHTTDVLQRIDSMQVEHQGIDEARAGDVIGILVGDHVRQHDTVYKVTP